MKCSQCKDWCLNPYYTQKCLNKIPKDLKKKQSHSSTSYYFRRDNNYCRWHHKTGCYVLLLTCRNWVSRCGSIVLRFANDIPLLIHQLLQLKHNLWGHKTQILSTPSQFLWDREIWDGRNHYLIDLWPWELVWNEAFSTDYFILFPCEFVNEQFNQKECSLVHVDHKILHCPKSM